MNKRLINLSDAYWPPFEGEESDTQNSSDRTFTQADVDKLMANYRKGLQTDLANKTAALEEVQRNLNLTAEEKEELASKLNEVQTTLLSQQELSDREKNRLKKEKESEIERLKVESESWKRRHDEMLVTNTLTQAAVKHKAYNPAQMVKLLAADAVITETDGQFKVQVKMTNKEGKPIQLDVEAALAEMSQDDSYINLFEQQGSEGLRRNNANGSKPLNVANLTPKQYREHRSEILGNK